MISRLAVAFLLSTLVFPASLAAQPTLARDRAGLCELELTASDSEFTRSTRLNVKVGPWRSREPVLRRSAH